MEQKGRKLTYSESGYVPPYSSIRCGTCIFFNKTGSCKIVSGKIHENACCNLWTKPGDKLNTRFSCGNDIEDILYGNQTKEQKRLDLFIKSSHL